MKFLLGTVRSIDVRYIYPSFWWQTHNLSLSHPLQCLFLSGLSVITRYVRVGSTVDTVFTVVHVLCDGRTCTRGIFTSMGWKQNM